MHKEPMRRSWYARAAPKVEFGLILLGLGNLVFIQGHGFGGDGYYRFLHLNQFLTTGHLPDGDYSLIGPLFATSLWVVGEAVSDPQSWVRYYNVIVFILGLVVAYRILRDKIDRTVLRRFLLLLVAGSMIAASVNDFYGETFTMVSVGCGLLAVVFCRGHRRVIGWTAVVLGVANTPASIVGLALVTGAETLRRHRWRVLIPLVLGAGLIALEIGIRNGGYVGAHGAQTIMPYSGRPGFSYPFLLGLAAVLFSFGRGLIFFVPGIFLPVWSRLRTTHGEDLARLYLLWMLFTGGLIVVYASWWAWHGGLSWGPRFFLIAILPASLALAVRLGTAITSLAADLFTLVALTLSVWGAVASTVYFGNWPPQCYGPGGVEELCHFAPEFSQLWYPAIARPDLTGLQLVVLIYYGIVLAWLAVPVVSRLADRLKRATPKLRHHLTRRWRF